MHSSRTLNRAMIWTNPRQISILNCFCSWIHWEMIKQIIRNILNHHRWSKKLRNFEKWSKNLAGMNFNKWQSILYYFVTSNYCKPRKFFILAHKFCERSDFISFPQGKRSFNPSRSIRGFVLNLNLNVTITHVLRSKIFYFHFKTEKNFDSRAFYPKETFSRDTKMLMTIFYDHLLFENSIRS